MSRAESDLADMINADDRERIMETVSTLMESSMCSIMSGGESEGEEGKVEGRRGSEKVHDRKRNRRRRRLPEIPKKREFEFVNCKQGIVS